MERVADLSKVKAAVSDVGHALLSALANVASKSRASAVMTKALMSSELRARVGLSQGASEAVAAGALATGAGTLVYLTVRALMAASRGGSHGSSEDAGSSFTPAAFASIYVRYWAAGSFAADVPQARIRRYLSVAGDDLSSTGRIKSLSAEAPQPLPAAGMHTGNAQRDRRSSRTSEEAAAAEIVMAGLGAVPADWESGSAGRGGASGVGGGPAAPQPYRKALPLHVLLGQPDVQAEACIEAHVASAAARAAEEPSGGSRRGSMVGGARGLTPLYAVCNCGSLSIRLPSTCCPGGDGAPLASAPALLCPPLAQGRPLLMLPYEAVGLTSADHFAKMTSAQVLPAPGMPTLAQYPQSTRLSTQVAAHALQCGACGVAPAYLFDTQLKPLPAKGSSRHGGAGAVPTEPDASSQRFTSLGFDVAALREGLRAPPTSTAAEAEEPAPSPSATLHVYLYPFNGWYVSRPDRPDPETTAASAASPYPVTIASVPPSWGGRAFPAAPSSKRHGATGSAHSGAGGMGAPSTTGRSPESSPRDDAASVASSVASGDHAFPVRGAGGSRRVRADPDGFVPVGVEEADAGRGGARAASAPAPRGGSDASAADRRHGSSAASVAGSVASRRSASSFASGRSGGSKRGAGGWDGEGRGPSEARRGVKPHSSTLRPGHPGYDPAVERFTQIYGNIADADAGRGRKKRGSGYYYTSSSEDTNSSSAGSESEGVGASADAGGNVWRRPARRGSIQEAMLAWAGQRPYAKAEPGLGGDRGGRARDARREGSSVASSRAGSVRSGGGRGDAWSGAGSTFSTPPHHHHHHHHGDAGGAGDGRRRGATSSGGSKQVQWAVSNDGSIDALTAAAMAGGGAAGTGLSRSTRRQKVRPAVAAAPPHPASFAPAPSFVNTPLQQSGGVVLRDVFGAPMRFGGSSASLPASSPISLASASGSLLNGVSEAAPGLLLGGGGRGATAVAAAAVVPASWGRDAVSWRERYRYAGSYGSGSGDEMSGNESLAGAEEGASSGSAAVPSAAVPALPGASRSSSATGNGPSLSVGFAPVNLPPSSGSYAGGGADSSHRLPPRRKASLPTDTAGVSSGSAASQGIRLPAQAAPVPLPAPAAAEEPSSAFPPYARLPPPLAAPQPAAALPARRAGTPSSEAAAAAQTRSVVPAPAAAVPARRGSLPPAHPVAAPAAQQQQQAQQQPALPLSLLSPGPPVRPPSTSHAAGGATTPPRSASLEAEFLSPDVGPATAARHRGDDWRPFMESPAAAAPEGGGRVIFGGNRGRSGRSGSLASLPDDADRGLLSTAEAAGRGAYAGGGHGAGRGSRSASLASAVDSLDGASEGHGAADAELHDGISSLDTSFEGGGEDAAGQPSAGAAPPAAAPVGGPRMVPALAESVAKKKKRRGGR